MPAGRDELAVPQARGPMARLSRSDPCAARAIVKPRAHGGNNVQCRRDQQERRHSADDQLEWEPSARTRVRALACGRTREPAAERLTECLPSRFRLKRGLAHGGVAPGASDADHANLLTLSDKPASSSDGGNAS